MEIISDAETYTTENLQKYSYRFLQQIAKALSLPSNVKKVYLIQLIHAKKFLKTDEVESLIRQVRTERKQLSIIRKRAKNKKKNVQQSAEISSTTNRKSPPITSTPKRVSHIMIRYSPDQYIPSRRINRQPNRTIGQTTISASDRVLRSFRNVKNPAYILNNEFIGIIKESCSERSIGRLNVGKEDKFQHVTSLLRKRSIGWRSNEIVKTKEDWKRSEILSLRQSNLNISPKPVIRQRRLSGIYPLNEKVLPVVSVRRADGSFSTLNAYVQKPNNFENQEQEQSYLIDSTDSNSTISIDNYRNVTIANISVDSESSLNCENSCEDVGLSYKEKQGEHTVYYHKKIRAEHIRSLRKDVTNYNSNKCRLPKIGQVFPKFNDVYNRDMSQPIYVQVPEMTPNPLLHPDMSSYQTSMLENLYNLKNVFLIHQPLLQISTTANTRCVYSTPTITTARPQASCTTTSGLYNIALSQDKQYSPEDTRVHDFFRNFHCDDGENVASLQRNSSSGSSGSQELGANVTIPEMVEDALELISQDGDYMERMGMDMRMQCILCDWAGPKIILECHIRKEHGACMVRARRSTGVSSWSARYTLGELARGACSVVLEHAALLVLSAQYEDPDCFCATLSTLGNEDDLPITGSITTYNKVTGEPFVWQGVIQQLPPNLTFENDNNCLKLELSKLNLLPNSANLKLLNRELVLNSTNKVVVGQPELDDIHITLIVKVND